MTKSKLKLVVGQRAFIERKYLYRDLNSKRELEEVEVVRANATSAYVTFLDKLGEEKPYTIKISQKDFKGRTSFDSVTLWLSKEDFEKDVADKKRKSELRSKLLNKVNKMPLEELEKLNTLIN